MIYTIKYNDFGFCHVVAISFTDAIKTFNDHWTERVKDMDDKSLPEIKSVELQVGNFLISKEVKDIHN